MNRESATIHGGEAVPQGLRMLDAVQAPAVLLRALYDPAGELTDFTYVHLNDPARTCFRDRPPVPGERLSDRPPPGAGPDLHAQALRALSGPGTLSADAGPAAPFSYRLTGISDTEVVLSWYEPLLERWRLLAQVSAGAVLVVDTDGAIAHANDAAAELFGYSGQQLSEMRVEDLLPETLREAHVGHRAAFREHPDVRLMTDGRELQGRRVDGQLFPVEAALIPMRANGQIYTAAVLHDISERARLRQALVELQQTDPLTGLLNRSAFMTELDEHLHRVVRGARGALLLIVVNDVEHLNATLGRAVADEVIQLAGQLLRDGIGARATLAHLSGGQFVALLADAELSSAMQIATDLLAGTGLSELAGVPLTGSAGVKVLDETVGGLTGAELLADAEEELRAQKVRNEAVLLLGGNVGAPARRRTLTALNEALAGEGFELFAQPIVPLRSPTSERIFEVLLRMRTADGELLSPAQFLPAAERFGLMPAIDRKVIAGAVALLEGAHGLRLSVNLAAESLADRKLAGYVAECCARHRVLPAALIFEVTEHAAIGSIPDAAALMGALAELGCELALDDFGYGFGSFQYLKALPFQIVKIAPAFAEDLDSDPQSAVMVKAMVDAARGLSKRTVVEGVSSRRALDRVESWQADHAQGFYLGRPEPANACLFG
ncbi:MAG TPA: EAL domain-containing protein [Solirubrobacteraceae bacterium]|nr:EAL domain-containing protein [Solirubrobacteraceae bacterium]